MKRCQLQVNKLWSWLQLARKRRKNIYCRLFIYISQHTYHALWDVFVLLYRVSFNLTYHWSIWCAFGMYRPQMIYRKFLKYQTANHRNHSSMNKYFGNSGNCFPSCLTPNYWPGNCINVFLQQIQLEVPKKKNLITCIFWALCYFDNSVIIQHSSCLITGFFLSNSYSIKFNLFYNQ